jgi:hypothetical protein
MARFGDNWELEFKPMWELGQFAGTSKGGRNRVFGVSQNFISYIIELTNISFLIRVDHVPIVQVVVE